MRIHRPRREPSLVRVPDSPCSGHALTLITLAGESRGRFAGVFHRFRRMVRRGLRNAKGWNRGRPQGGGGCPGAPRREVPAPEPRPPRASDETLSLKPPEPSPSAQPPSSVLRPPDASPQPLDRSPQPSSRKPSAPESQTSGPAAALEPQPAHLNPPQPSPLTAHHEPLAAHGSPLTAHGSPSSARPRAPTPLRPHPPAPVPPASPRCAPAAAIPGLPRPGSTSSSWRGRRGPPTGRGRAR